MLDAVIPINSPARLRLDALTSPHGGPFNLELAAGECVAVTGRSGSGKSVLLRLTADLDPHQGEVWLDGYPRSGWTGPQWRRRVVYQAAEPAWWAPTAAAHLQMNDRALLVATLTRLGLTEVMLDTDIARLSTGERQRMALLRSLECKPAVLLLDEPTASLDEGSSLTVESLLGEWLEQGMAAIVVTHSRGQADRIGHRVFEVRDHQLRSA